MALDFVEGGTGELQHDQLLGIMDDRRRLTYLGGKLLKLSVEGLERVDHAIAELETRGLRSIATYLRNASDELFIVKK